MNGNILAAKWSFVLSERANKDIKKLDPGIKRRISNFIEKTFLKLMHPRAVGKPLSGNLDELWSYRVGDYRILCEIHDHKLQILAVHMDHRSKFMITS